MTVSIPPGARNGAAVPSDLPDLPPTGTRAGEPPGVPFRWWGLPVLWAMRQDFLGYAQARHRAHGDLCRLRILSRRGFDLFNPDLVRELLVDHAGVLERRPRGVRVLARCFGLGQGVLTTEGDTWQRQRRMLMPAFSPKRVAGYAGLMRASAAAALDAAVPAHAAQALVDMDELFSRVAMDAILRTLFGRAARDEVQATMAALRVLGQAAMRELIAPFTLPDWLPLPAKRAKRRALGTLRAVVGGHIARRRAEGATSGGDDLLARLLALRDEATGQALSEQEVFDQCMVSFQAGHETTATALLWWGRLLAAHPDAAARAREEVDAVLAGRDPGADDLPALPWLTATLKEAIRLYPPLPAMLTRRTLAPITLQGWRMPAGTVFYVTPWVLHRDPRWWPQPDAFQPERFMPGAPEAPRGAYIPFGTGPRVCLGQHFAMLEMTIVAAMLLRRYELEVPEGEVEPVPVLNVTLRPQSRVRLKLRRRAA